MGLDALLNKVATQGKDQSVASGGSFDYTPPAKGVTGARIVGYYEQGKHEFEFENKKKTQDEVAIVFELIGPNHPPIETDNGKIPVRMTLTLGLSTNEKAHYFKIFSRLRNEEKHFVQLLGKPVLLEVIHKPGKKDPSKTFAEIDKASIRKPVMDVPELENGIPTGKFVSTVIPVGQQLTPLGAFVWDFADAEMWDSIFIEGEYPERKDEKTGKVIAAAQSKNKIQLKIASALNFKGLPCYDYAAAKLSGSTAITKEGVDALDEVVGDVSNVGSVAGQGTSGEEDDKPPFPVDDPMAGIA
ncbi:hypothetical protein [Xanthomonas phage f20-Xaj]|uniref:Uncharacterized protein n=1 Tax=Xanthomonas phage f20-Xaj TaxID=1784979 RepID=A0A127AWU0_9CAUD|nr:hypothetical protein FDI07_gp48 [Xanthomonas phage f20-Xaj]AMM44674.1 hypothetical protein [Xanthomonas phage f20-Xaj]